MRKQNLYGLIFLLFLMVFCSFAFCKVAASDFEESNPEFQAYFKKGTQLQNSRDYAGAEIEFGNAIRIEPNDWSAHFQKAVCLLYRGLFKDALREVDQAVNLEPSSSPPQHFRAIILFKLNRYKESIEQIGILQQKFPNYENAFYAKVLLAANLYKLERLEEVCNLAVKAIGEENIKPAPLLLLASLVKGTGRMDLEAYILRFFARTFPEDLRAKDAISTAVCDEGDYFFATHNCFPQAKKDWALSLRKHSPITVCIISTAKADPGLIELTKNAFAEWERLAAPTIKFKYVDDSKQADIVFEWVSDSTSIRARSATLSPTPAEAQSRKRPDGSNQEWILSTLTPVSMHEFRIRSLHEIGHALGLIHSIEFDDVMSAFGSPRGLPPGLSKNDLSRLKELYADPIPVLGYKPYTNP